jgi:hypothetical protein
MQFVLPSWLVAAAAAAVQQLICTQLNLNSTGGNLTWNTILDSNCLEVSGAADVDGTFLAPQWFRFERASVSPHNDISGSFIA